MKKIVLVAALAIVGGALFAQAPGPGMGPGMGSGMGRPGMGQGPDAIEWKLGTVVTTEYKKVTGKVTLSDTLGGFATFKADQDYELRLPRLADLPSLKTGDTVTIEGLFTTVKGETKVAPSVRPLKITVNGKEIDVSDLGPGRDRDRDDRKGGPRG